MKRFGIAAVLLIVLALSPEVGRACWVCDKPADLAQALKRYPVVFIGSAVTVHPEVIQFKVIENFGVDLPPEVTMDANACVFRFVQGKTYLVFTTRTEKKRLLAPATTCSRTSAITDAADDIAALRERHHQTTP